MDPLDLGRDGVPVHRHGEHQGVSLQDSRSDHVEIIIKGAGLPGLETGLAGMATANIHHGGIKPGNGVPLGLCRLNKSIRHSKAVTVLARAARNGQRFSCS